MKRINLRTLIMCALLAAIGAVFSAFLSVEIPISGTKLVEISLTPVVVMLAGILFGPLLGGVVGFLSDFFGFFMGAQYGAYNPAFSISMALFGVIAGLFFLKRKEVKWLQTVIMVIIAQVICSVLTNTYAIHFFYGVPLQALFIPRAVSAAVEVPIYVILLLPLSVLLGMLKNKNSGGEVYGE